MQGTCSSLALFLNSFCNYICKYIVSINCLSSVFWCSVGLNYILGLFTSVLFTVTTIVSCPRISIICNDVRLRPFFTGVDILWNKGLKYNENTSFSHVGQRSSTIYIIFKRIETMKRSNMFQGQTYP